LDENYPRERRKIIELDIRNNYLEGELDLSDFVGLEKLNCSNNRLTNLVLPSNSTNLSYLDISDTDLDKIDVGKLPKSLETIKYCT
jgi:Leucine-rich repeat (LRR) protein